MTFWWWPVFHQNVISKHIYLIGYLVEEMCLLSHFEEICLILEGAKSIGAGAAIIASMGVAVGIGNVFGISFSIIRT